MTEKKSNFARMDELEAEENLQSEDTLLERITPWEYSGRKYWLLRKLRLSPVLAAGIGMVLAGLILMQLQMDFFGWSMLGFGTIVAIFGVFEKLMIDWEEKD